MRKALATAICIAALATSVGCSRDGGRMVFHGSLRDEVKTLDPLSAYDPISLEVVSCIFETLYQYGYLLENYRVVPLLAADMPKISADRLTVTIPLKRGARFQDDPAFKQTGGKGREVHAGDIIYALKRHALPNLHSQNWSALDGHIVGLNAFRDKLWATPREKIAEVFGEPIEGLKDLDDHTLQIKLTHPYPQLLHVLAQPFTAPIAHEAAEAYQDKDFNLTEHPVGSGPFSLKRWKRGTRIVLDRNPTYHPDFYPADGAVDLRSQGMLADAGKPLPLLDRITWEVVKDEKNGWQMFIRGKSDVMTLPKENFPQAITNQVNLSPELAAQGIRMDIETGVRFYYLSFNMKDKVLGRNKLLRQAISSAIDRDRWIGLMTNGTGKKAVSALPPGVPDRPQKSELKYDFNLPRAKDLLKKAGFPGGKNLSPMNFDMPGNDTLNHQLGRFFTEQLGAVGIHINVVYNDFPTYLEKMKKTGTQISYGGWGMDYPDAENVYKLLYGPNPELNKLYEKMAIMESGPERAAIIKRMDEILQEECPWALGYYFAEYRLSQPWLQNYRPRELVTNKYKYLRIKRDIKARYLDGK